MKLAPKSAAALAPALLALAACGGGNDQADEPAAGTTPEAIEPAAVEIANPAPGETPVPAATPSEAPGAAPMPAAPAPVAAAEPPQVFNQCTACHSTEPGKDGIGPTLAGVFGRRAGTLAGHEFSQAMKDSGLTWNQASLDRYLENPRGVVPGTTMAHGGVKDPAQRQALINYLKTL